MNHWVSKCSLVFEVRKILISPPPVALLYWVNVIVLSSEVLYWLKYCILLCIFICFEFFLGGVKVISELYLAGIFVQQAYTFVTVYGLKYMYCMCTYRGIHTSGSTAYLLRLWIEFLINEEEIVSPLPHHLLLVLSWLPGWWTSAAANKHRK